VSFYEHLSEFVGKPVVDYTAGMEIDPRANVYRLRVDYDSEEGAAELLSDLLSRDDVEQLTGLIIGQWASEMYEVSASGVIEVLIAGAAKLQQLRGLFIGEMTSEENEVSWIQQTDVSPIWSVFPRLEEVRIRGSQSLSLGRSPLHANLRTLTIECGGLPRSVLAEIAAANFPSLETLELYLGDNNYGWDGSVADLDPILSGRLFPKLKYLGLRDSSEADEVAAAVARAPIVERLEVLDLSLGTLGDVGAEALLASPAIRKLKKLDLHRHFISEEVSARLATLPCEVNLEDPQDEEDNDRYVAISE
jgi:hypothetical protein